MPYDEAMAERVRDLLDGTPGLVEKKMFGGIGWTVYGNMAVGAHSDGRLMVRCSRENFASYLAEPGVGGMIRNDKPMMGWLLVDAATVDSDAGLAHWVGRGKAFAQGLPPK